MEHLACFLPGMVALGAKTMGKCAQGEASGKGQAGSHLQVLPPPAALAPDEPLTTCWLGSWPRI
jgi:hypothetical protein